MQSPKNVRVLWVWGDVALLEIFFGPHFSAPEKVRIARVDV